MASLNNKENNFETLKWIYKRSKKFIPAIILRTFLSVIISLSLILLAFLSKNILDIATGNAKGNIVFYGIVIIAIIVGQIILDGLNSILTTYTGGKFLMSLRNHLFVSLSKKKFANFSEFHSGDLLNRLSSDTEVLINSTLNIIPNVAAMAAKIIGGVYTLLILDKRIALIILVAGITVPAIGRVINKRFKYLHKSCQKTEGETRSFMQECFENMVVMKTFQGVTPFSKKLSQFMKQNFRFKMKRVRISVVTHLSLYSLFTMGYYVVLLWGANQISKGAITFGTLTAFLQLIQQLRAPLQNISGVIPQYYSALASAERLIELECIPEDNHPVTFEKLKQIENNFNFISFDNVSFAYKSDNILQNCSFTIPKNKITAITGESGSGKSTVFKILLGLYEPNEGNITINNETTVDASIRGIFAYVPQGNLVLSGGIKENLTLYDDSVGMDDIVTATKAAEIYDLIESMPDGFNTILSERGAGLSEGQIQRIAIARALLTKAPILLLDEATSALDEETETKVLNNIKNLTNKTVLFVTHRNTSLKACDRIIHVENKKFSVIKE